MGFFGKKRTQKDKQSENLDLMAGVFTECHNTICDTLNRQLGGRVPLFGNPVPLKIENASRFEVGMYLLFHIDLFSCGRQQEDARTALFTSCMYSILPSKEPRFIRLAYHRSEVYGRIFNQTKNSGGDFGACMLRCNDWLINAILYSQNDYNKMTTDAMPEVIVGIIERFHIKIAMETVQFFIFDNILECVVANNDDFRSLSPDELIGRINCGEDQGRRAVERIAKEQRTRPE
jgi:hypothetical protein